MKITTPKSKQIYQWLLERGLSHSTIENCLDWNGHEIVIPIYDINKNFLFNKYRKDPTVESDAPKYRYEKGSSATLFNSHTVKNLKNDMVFVLEGELDALLLSSLGLKAVSSTGGASTFKEEWLLDFCNNDIYIVYDKDTAGIQGALRINKMLPRAKIVFLPDNFKGKDITDFFQTHTMKEFETLVNESESWVLPIDRQEIPDTKKAINGIINSYNHELDALLERKHILDYKQKSTKHIEIMMDIIEKRVVFWDRILNNFGKKFNNNGDDIARAKSVPITNYIKFDNDGFASCLWHIEKTPSMQYKPERNKVFCYSCGAHRDTIDVVMELKDLSFMEAIKFINN